MARSERGTRGVQVKTICLSGHVQWSSTRHPTWNVTGVFQAMITIIVIAMIIVCLRSEKKRPKSNRLHWARIWNPFIKNQNMGSCAMMLQRLGFVSVVKSFLISWFSRTFLFIYIVSAEVKHFTHSHLSDGRTQSAQRLSKTGAANIKIHCTDILQNVLSANRKRLRYSRLHCFPHCTLW